jgi:predicted N-formylglutamate amidohydrolase
MSKTRTRFIARGCSLDPKRAGRRRAAVDAPSPRVFTRPVSGVEPDFAERALLGADEPPPFEVLESDGNSPFLITCDHSGRRIPRALGSLGLPESELERHIAWDIGAAGVARSLAQELSGFLILQTYSRLVIDCNRPLGVPSSIAELSEDTVIPGNQNLRSGEAERRARAIFRPYHERIERELERRAQTGQQTVLIAMHSFTPSYRGVDRPWHTGMLYQRDAGLAHALIGLLRKDPKLVVGDNEPYSVSDLSDYGIVVHGERRRIPHVEIEIRQDLLSSELEQAAWGRRLAALLPEACGALGFGA